MVSFPPSLSHSSVIHTLSISHSVLLAKFHTTCPRQSRFTDYHPLYAKRITHKHTCRWKASLGETHTLPGMQCHAGCPCVSLSSRLFIVCLSDGNHGGPCLRFSRWRGSGRQRPTWAHAYILEVDLWLDSGWDSMPSWVGELELAKV